MKRNSHVIKALLFSSALVTAQSVAAQDAPVQPAPDQETAAETAGEGDAKAAGEPAVPTSEGVVSNDDRTLEEIVVTGRIGYRNRTETVAPELTYGQEFFQKFEPTSVGDSLKRVPGVSFGSDIGEYDAPALARPGRRIHPGPGERAADPRRRQRPQRARRPDSGRNYRPDRNHPLADRRPRQPGHWRIDQYHPEGRRQPPARHHHARRGPLLSGRQYVQRRRRFLAVGPQPGRDCRLLAHRRRPATVQSEAHARGGLQRRRRRLRRQLDREGPVQAIRPRGIDRRRADRRARYPPELRPVVQRRPDIRARRAEQGALRWVPDPHPPNRHRANHRPRTAGG